MANRFDQFHADPATPAYPLGPPNLDVGPPTPERPNNRFDQFHEGDDQESLIGGPAAGDDPISRVGGAMGKAFMEGVQPDNSLGLGPETVQKLHDVGIFLNKRSHPLAQFVQHLNKALMEPSAVVADAALRTLLTAFKVPIAGAAQGAEELGLGKAKSNERDIEGLFDTLAIMFPPLGFLRTSTQARNLTRTTPPRMAAERGADEHAFRDLDIEVPGPALTDAGLAGAAKQVEKAPFLGGPLVKQRDRVLEGTANAARDVAEEYGRRGDPEQAGQTIQRGMERFRTSEVQDLDRPTATAAGVPFRTHLDDMTDDQVETLVSTPASRTSVATRIGALYESAHRKLPALFRSNATRNPNLMPTPNSGRAVRGMIREETSARIQGGAVHGRFGPMIESLANPQSNWTIDGLRAARTQVGRTLGGFAREAASLDRTQLKQLYGGISQDLEAAYVEIYRRARENRRLYHNQPNDPRYVTAEVVANARRALTEFRRADRYTRLSHSRMDRLLRVTRAGHPEDALKVVMRAANKNTRNIGLIREARAALNGDEWGEVLGQGITQMGVPGKQAKGLVAELQFSPSTWAGNWRGMDPAARRVMFRGAGNRELEESLNSLARVTQRLDEYEALTNYSRTATQLIGASTVILAPAYIASGAWATALTAAVGTYGFAKFMASPTYVRWLTRAYRMAASGGARRQIGAAQWAQHANRLRALAGRDPELGPALNSIIQKIAGEPESDAVADE